MFFYLISDCETLTIASESVIKHSEKSVQANGINIENSEFSNLLCGSERVTVVDVKKPRISLLSQIVSNPVAHGQLATL